MIFTTPVLLATLALLPVLWWLLRATPPAPRQQRFPAIRLLAGLQGTEETPSRTPWWLLLVRLAAAALLIVGLAGPVLQAGRAPDGAGPLLLVIDNGWAAARDWPARLRAAQDALDRAETAGRDAALLATAPANALQPVAMTPVMKATALRPILAALRPQPWPPDRVAAAQALNTAGPQGDAAGARLGTWTVYIADGIATDGDAAFAQALAGQSVQEMRSPPAQRLLRLLPQDGALRARVDMVPDQAGGTATVLAQSGDGRSLARAVAQIAPGSDGADIALDLPAALRNRLSRLVVQNSASAGAVLLLDDASRRPVGLVSTGDGADAPLLGPLYYVRRALAGHTELREADLDRLLNQPVSVIVLADMTPSPDQARKLLDWVRKGGVLIRFAGPALADAAAQAAQDPLLPVPLLGGDRSLGGALSWNKPAHLAPFPAGSPFTGLPVPDDVTVSRQVLAQPSPLLAQRSWAQLTDGTPLVTGAAEGAGRVVLFHVTANADWSNLPLSGLFPDMLQRLSALASGVGSGVAPGVAGADAPLPPLETLDGFGTLGTPPPGVQPVLGQATGAGPRHPPGFYGTDAARHAVNLGDSLPKLRAAGAIPGAVQHGLGGEARERRLGPDLVGVALGLLAADMLAGLWLRGLLRGWRRIRPALPLGLLLLAALPAQTQAQTQAQTSAQTQNDAAALETRLAYVQTADSAVNAAAQSGLAGLSAAVNRRTAARLGEPVAVTPGRDDLSFYPLLYWPITADAALSDQGAAALNAYMRNGGVILIDTRDSGSGAGFNPGTEDALKRVSAGLDIPPLAPLTPQHVLAHAFYLLPDFPGRFTGGQVWVQRDEERGNDSVSPVIVGGNDWAAAWAVDADGRTPFAMLPGGERQRSMAIRFGVNLVMYALTGNYKGDQVHVPALLQRLGK